LTAAGGFVHSDLIENVSHLTGRARMAVWIKRLAAAGFLFFLIKGLVWLGIALSVMILCL